MSAGANPKPTGALNTFTHSLSEDEWRGALARVKAQRKTAVEPDKDRRSATSTRRDAVRRCLLRVDRGQNPAGIYVVRTVDISETGARVLHGGPIEPDTACCLIIETNGRGSVASGGVVAWCKPVEGLDLPAYEIGLRFNTTIDADLIIEDPPTSEEAA